MNIVYESVGGEMFQTCMNSLAVFGRMVLIGMISQVCVYSVYLAHTPLGWQYYLSMACVFPVWKVQWKEVCCLHWQWFNFQFPVRYG